MADGSLRVRKSSKGDAPPGPWGVSALRREIAYLSALPPGAHGSFPPLLAVWDEAGAVPSVGYEVPLYAEHTDAGELARRSSLTQAEVDEFQDALASALLDEVQVPLCEIAGFDDGQRDYSYRVRWESPLIAPFQTRDWHTRLRRAFEAKYGAWPRRLYALIDGYFSVAMAVNTSGVQRRARLLKATLDFNAARVSSSPP